MEKTTYKQLADSLFNKIKDYNFANMDEETAYSIVINYISPATIKFQSCTQDLTDRDDELQEFGYVLTYENFELLVNYMVIEWLTSNYITTAQALKSRLSTSDFHSLQQSQMLAKAVELRATLLSENDSLAINKSYSPKYSKLYEVATGRKKV